MTGAQFVARLLRLWGLAPSLSAWVARGDDLEALSPAWVTPDVISFVARAFTDPQGASTRQAQLDGLAARLGDAGRLTSWAALVAPRP